MPDLDRLFHQLVTTLAAADPGSLNRPVSLHDIRQSVLPYRTSRRAVGVDSVEEYDLLLLRLAAGEGGFARTSPEDARARFVAESMSSNPDLDVLDRHADAVLTLEGLRVARALAASDDDPYAPPAPEPEPAPSGDSPPEAPVEADVLDLDIASAPAATAGPDVAGLMCLYCGATLPTGRTVNFCPSCGQSQTTPRCPQCQCEVELGWRHCITCGAALAGV
jgi:hypothetical protein